MNHRNIVFILVGFNTILLFMLFRMLSHLLLKKISRDLSLAFLGTNLGVIG